MIERKFIAEKIKELEIREYMRNTLNGVGYSDTKVLKTPLGEKIIISASRPGLVVGKKGQNIKMLTKTLKKKFGMENPQIEISEVDNINLDASIIAEDISNSLERFGSQKFKAIGHKMMAAVMGSGALGIEILISGKIPSSRAKSWRFYSGYLKKCGDISVVGVRKAVEQAQLKTGVVGIKVSIMPPDIKLPDDIQISFESGVEEVDNKEKSEEENVETKEEPKVKKETKDKSEVSEVKLEKEKQLENKEDQKSSSKESTGKEE